MKRYKKFVLEAEKGITFELSNGTSGELIVEALNIDTQTNIISKKNTAPKIAEGENQVPIEENGNQNIATIDVSSFNFANPPIPKGYSYVCGEWYNGFVIARCSDSSEFVWVPVGFLDANGTLDGHHYTEKYGRRRYYDWNFSDAGTHESFTKEFSLQVESVKKYGGFYLSRYNISISSKDKPQSIRGVIPCSDVSGEKAKEIAATLENNEAVKSHLIFGSEYDSVLEWFLKSNAKTFCELSEYSFLCGNSYSRDMLRTGFSDEWRINNIYDFVGNAYELTQELSSGLNVCRGFCYQTSRFCVGTGAFTRLLCSEYFLTSFRVALWLK